MEPDTSESTKQPTTIRKKIPELGTLYLRGKTWYIEYWRNNVQYRESSKSDQEKKAVKLLKQRRDEMAKDEFIKPKATKVTMRDLFALVIADYESRENRSHETLAHRLKPLHTFFDDRRATEITEHTLERYKGDRLRAGLSKATINRELAVIRRAYKLATKGKDKLVSPNVVPAIEMYPEHNVREGFIEYADCVELTSHLPSPIDDVAWFAFWMGWRKEQILSLTWPDISLEAGTIIRRAEFNKNKRPSVLPMVDYVREIVERRWQGRLVMTAKGPQVCDRVFHRDGKRIKDFRGAWEAACIKAGLYRVVRAEDGTERKDVAHFHDFRRSCVSNLENFGTPRKVAKSISGHITDSVYERYHIVRKEDQQAALTRVGAGLRGSYLHKTPQKPAQVPQNDANATVVN